MMSSDDLFQGAKWRKYPLPMSVRIEVRKDKRLKKPARLHVGGSIQHDFADEGAARLYIAEKIIPAFEAVLKGFRSVADGEADSYSQTDGYIELKNTTPPSNTPPPGTPVAAIG